jgi:hypothetical protein
MRSNQSYSSEQGTATPLSLVLGLGLIVMPVLVLVLTLPTWEQRTVDAQDAARDAARALVMADDWGDGVAAADQAVYEIVSSDGLVPGDVSLRLAGSLAPGATVTASVTVLVPAGNFPGLGFIGTLHYTASSTEHVDASRDSAS